MAAESVQNEMKRAPTAQHTGPSGEHVTQEKLLNGNHGAKKTQEQNPELLHWRANVLLDEMMLGAIDIAAGDTAPARALASQPASRQNEANSDTADAYRNGNHNGANVHRQEQDDRSEDNRSSGYSVAADDASNGADDTRLSAKYQPHREQASTYDPGYSSDHTEPQYDLDPPSHGSSQAGRQSVRSGRQTHSNRAPAATDHVRTSASTPAQPTVAHGTEQWLFAAEQRYQQIAARRYATHGAAESVPLYDYDGWSMTPAQDASADYGLQPDPHVARPASAAYAVPVEKSNGVRADFGGAAAKPSGISAGARKSLRSNLLPRMNVLDNRSVQQEMAMLQGNIESILPTGHESRARAQHLLEKAGAILQTDPAALPKWELLAASANDCL
ncbi:MAG: hypothetical protein R2932_07640 [Caldilineaceae bacterium]